MVSYRKQEGTAKLQLTVIQRTQSICQRNFTASKSKLGSLLNQYIFASYNAIILVFHESHLLIISMLYRILGNSVSLVK